MRNLIHNGYFLPPSLRDEISEFKERVHHFKEEDISLTIRTPHLTPSLVRRVIDHLREAQQRLLEKRPVKEIVEILDEASRRWMNTDYPPFRFCLETIPLLTGFSREMVAESIFLEHRSSRKPDLLRALESELGNPSYLDGFQPSPQLDGFCRAFGPEVIMAIFSANIPGLPHLSIMRSFLVKSACLGKVSSEEPIFPPLYAETLEQLDSEVAECLAILEWKGGDEEIEHEVFHRCGAVIAYGSEETCNSLRSRIHPQVKLVTHSHKLGFGLIGRNALRISDIRELARRAAYDVGVFDQHACLSPHIYFVEEEGEASPREFARELATALDKLEEKLPSGKIGIGTSATLQQLRESLELRESAGEDVQVFHSPAHPWTVIYERTASFLPSPLNRVIRVVPLRDIFEAEDILRPVACYLQNAALELEDERRGKMFDLLGKLGVSRIVPPGKMPTPSMMWHHDGLLCLATLLRWTDVEMF